MASIHLKAAAWTGAMNLFQVSSDDKGAEIKISYKSVYIEKNKNPGAYKAALELEKAIKRTKRKRPKRKTAKRIVIISNRISNRHYEVTEISEMTGLSANTIRKHLRENKLIGTKTEDLLAFTGPNRWLVRGHLLLSYLRKYYKRTKKKK